MRIALKKIAVTLLLSLCFAIYGVGAQQQSAESPLTNASVIKLVRAGFKEKTLIAIIRSRPVRFDLAPDKLIELKRSGVTERVILVMLARDGENALMADEGWSDDPFFDDPDGSSRSRRNGAGGDGGTGIFGSGSGSSSRTRGRGLSGANQDDTESTGSASVRIIRPPAEAGGAPPTLERTPTLMNDRVVELVEAGFSEGTIIRRIEQSPAEFDLSTARLAELRRRRVSEPIINAMRAAMGDDQTSNATRSNPTP
ncbi:MAG TPA: hypothetical protein VE842_14770 [Pyrinomonadaceae bacterium]|nr:hypothetical protein [Pyrinomonadaceae bacterium]